jgi:hypothetical protein
MIIPLEVNYFFHVGPTHVLTYVHDAFIFEVSIRWIATIVISDQWLCNTNDKTSHMSITYFARVPGVSLVLYKKLAHVVRTEDCSKWLLLALYNK